MSRLVLYLPTLHAAAIWDRLTQQTKAIHQATMANTDDGGGADNADGHAIRDPRTFDQIRTDLACDLLLTGQPTDGPDEPHGAGVGIRAKVLVVIPVLSLLGRPAVEGGQPDPAMLAGYGPIGLDDALALAADAPQWVRVLTHPVTGMVLTVDTYRPSKKLKRFLRLRDGRCRFPHLEPATPKDRDRPHLRLGLRRQNHTRQPGMFMQGRTPAQTPQRLETPTTRPRRAGMDQPTGPNHHRPTRHRHPRSNRTLLRVSEELDHRKPSHRSVLDHGSGCITRRDPDRRR